MMYKHFKFILIITISVASLVTVFKNVSQIRGQSENGGLKLGTFNPTPRVGVVTPTDEPTALTPTTPVLKPTDEPTEYLPGCEEAYKNSYGSDLLDDISSSPFNFGRQVAVLQAIRTKYGLKADHPSYEEVLIVKEDQVKNEIIKMAQMTYRLFGNLPDNPARSYILEALEHDTQKALNRKGTIVVEDNYRKLGWNFMTAYQILERSASNKTLNDIERDLAQQTCEERMDTIQKLAQSPLKVITNKQQEMTVLVHNPLYYMDQYYPRGYSFKFQTVPENLLKLEDGTVVNEIPFDYIAVGHFAPVRGYVVSQAQLPSAVEPFVQYLKLTGIEEQIVQLLKNKLPRAPYYYISLLYPSAVEHALTWDIQPKPSNTYKYIFYARPLVQPIVVSPPIFEEYQELRLNVNERDTVIYDYNVIIDYK